MHEEIRAKVLLQNPLLQRYWFRVNSNYGFGATAYSREDAETILAAAGLRDWLNLHVFYIESVEEDIDLQTLEEIRRHYSLVPLNVCGVRCPFRSLQEHQK